MMNQARWKKRVRNWTGSLAGLALALASSCQSDTGSGAGVEPDDPGVSDGVPTDYEPAGGGGECQIDTLLAPHAYGAKVKTLLTGLALSKDELSQLQQAHGPDKEAKPEAVETLKVLVAQWLDTDEADAVLRGFFKSAFQQTEGTNRALFHQLGQRLRRTRILEGENKLAAGRSFVSAEQMLHATFAESFARTALSLVRQNKPFNETLTTDTYEMSTAQMVYLAFRDEQVIKDNGKKDGDPVSAADLTKVTLLKQQPPGYGDEDDILSRLEMGGSKFLEFYDERMQNNAACPSVLEVHWPPDPSGWQMNEQNAFNGSSSYLVFDYMVLGAPIGISPAENGPPGCTLGQSGGGSVAPLLQKKHYRDWRTVKLVQVDDAADVTKFWKVPQLVHDTPTGEITLKVRTAHSGFLTSPGFLSTWPSNIDNQMRVTTNQALIVALGRSFSGVERPNYQPDYNSEENDASHAEEAECYACHQTLDPMRAFYRGTLSYYYGHQTGEAQNHQAQFRFGDPAFDVDGTGVKDLANALAQHEWFATGWVQKLCHYANTRACPEREEFERIVQIFVGQDYDFAALLTELFSSPLVTGNRCGSDLGAPPPVTVSRRATFCSQIEHRLGAEQSNGESMNICGSDRMTALDGKLANGNQQQDFGQDRLLRRNIRDAMAAIPTDTFSRDQAEPIVMGDTSLFVYGSREAACSHYANNQQNEDQEGAFDKVFGDGAFGERSDALDKMVTTVMGMPVGHPVHEQALALLSAHAEKVYAEQVDAEASENPERTARQSAFILACMSPSSAGVGF